MYESSLQKLCSLGTSSSSDESVDELLEDELLEDELLEDELLEDDRSENKKQRQNNNYMIRCYNY